MSNQPCGCPVTRVCLSIKSESPNNRLPTDFTVLSMLTKIVTMPEHAPLIRATGVFVDRPGVLFKALLQGVARKSASQVISSHYGHEVSQQGPQVSLKGKGATKEVSGHDLSTKEVCGHDLCRQGGEEAITPPSLMDVQTIGEDGVLVQVGDFPPNFLRASKLRVLIFSQKRN